MADREKVVKALEICGAMQYAERGVTCPTGCPYYEKMSCQAFLLEDANELLKEQEPVEPSVDVDTYVCPNCGHRLEHQGMLGDNVVFDERYNFCPACGKAVKWE